MSTPITWLFVWMFYEGWSGSGKKVEMVWAPDQVIKLKWFWMFISGLKKDSILWDILWKSFSRGSVAQSNKQLFALVRRCLTEECETKNERKGINKTWYENFYRIILIISLTRGWYDFPWYICSEVRQRSLYL